MGSPTGQGIWKGFYQGSFYIDFQTTAGTAGSSLAAKPENKQIITPYILITRSHECISQTESRSQFFEVYYLIDGTPDPSRACGITNRTNSETQLYKDSPLAGYFDCPIEGGTWDLEAPDTLIKPLPGNPSILCIDATPAPAPAPGAISGAVCTTMSMLMFYCYFDHYIGKHDLRPSAAKR